MTLRMVDSFDHYVSADTNEKWTSSSVPIITAGAGRRGTACMRFTSGGSFCSKTLDAQATWIMGAAVKFNALVAGSFFDLLDAGSAQVDLRLKIDGTLEVTRNGTVLGTTSWVAATGVFYYIELKVLINNTTGTVDLKIDGTSRLSLTSQDTQNTANATANQVQISSITGIQIDFDDLYFCDGAGSTNNNFLGDSRVDAFLPNGVGNSSQLTRGGADSGANWSQVDEAAPNDDTDYVESATVGQKDTYTFQDITHTPTTIFGVQILAHAKKDDAGARSIAVITRSGVTESDGPTEALSSGYIYYFNIRELNPDTGLAWTKVNFNSAEFGEKVAA